MTPLERAAIVLWQADREPTSLTPSMSIPDSDDWRDYIPKARAVLQAIREPSDQYVTDVVNGAEDVIAWGDYKEFWQAMIDAALEEGRE